MRNAQDVARSLIVDDQFWEYFNGWDAYMNHQELPDDASEIFKAGWGDGYAFCEMQEASRD